ncbi:MAG: SDR family NAD(P)-dependent oxidoreductase [Thermodesulfobacteriota bacterium]
MPTQKVMVTGGTGFVGSHTVAELVRNGYRVRLLVRNLERARESLSPLGIKDFEAVLGDVTDQKSVEQAAEGCSATIHCGSVYSLDSRAAARIKKTNVQGTDIVIKAAWKFGHDPIVHVSSVAALVGAKKDILSPASLPGTPPGIYSRSKADSDRVARKYQDNGAPVVITYPGSVWGPHDPHFGESCQMAVSILRRYWSVTPKGIVWITDVRDLARLHAALIEKGRGPRRYIAPVTNVGIREAISIMGSVIGRRLSTFSLPAWTLLWLMQTLDWLQLILPFRLPVNYQAVYMTGLFAKMDDSATRKEFGIEPKPLDETFFDTIKWMVETGHLSPRLAGRLAKES